MSRVIPAQGKVSHHAPQVINSKISPSSSHFAGTIQAPDLLHLTAEFFPDNFFVFISGFADSSGKYNKVRVKRAVVFEFQSGLGELLDDGIALESDLSVNDQLASSHVCEKDQSEETIPDLAENKPTKVESSGAAERERQRSCTCRSICQLEPFFLKSVQNVPIMMVSAEGL